MGWEGKERKGWDEMGRDGMGRKGWEWDEMGWNGMGWNGMVMQGSAQHHIILLYHIGFLTVRIVRRQLTDSDIDD